MSNYNGRRGPNVSHFLRDLNAIPTHQEPVEDKFSNNNMEDELALFTNTQFFDLETGQNTDYQAQPVKVVDTETTPSASASDDMTPAQSVMGDIANFDFMQGDFGFADFTSPYPSTPLNGFADGAQNFQSMQPNPSTVYAQIPQQQQQAQHQFAQPAPRVPEKRKADNAALPARPISLEEASRLAAEEDKRRRNTAASARFRIKKKQREQALEKSAKEMTEKVNNLESKVQQLEMENKWLKNLLVEKNEGNEEIVTLWKEFASSKAVSDKSKPESKQDSSVKEEQR